MANEVKLTFAGDAKPLQQETAKADTSARQLTDSVEKSSSKIGDSFGKVNSAAAFMAAGIGNLGDAVGTLTHLSSQSAERADGLARAHNDAAQAAQDMTQAMADARQAQLDLSQAQQDAVQAALDVEQAQRDAGQAVLDVSQAQLDAKKAQQDYTAAVKEHGKDSVEAKQALLDVKQAQQDLSQAQGDAKQATEDVRQAQLDANQATEDSRQANLDAAQATIDVKDAQLNLNQAQRDAIPPTAIEEWAARVGELSPILFTAIGAVQLLTTSTAAAKVAALATSAATGVWTGVQWALNAAFIASPIGWIVLGIGALVAVVVLIATKTTWFQDLWRIAWGGIKSAASAVWEWLKGLPESIGATFKKIGDFITAPFRAAFNFIADAWNNTIGKLSWHIPFTDITISAPQLPHFHSGGRVPGLPSQEVLAVLRGGEEVRTEAQQAQAASGGDTYITNHITVNGVDELAELLEFLADLRNNGRRKVVMV